eukprot:272248_1
MESPRHIVASSSSLFSCSQDERSELSSLNLSNPVSFGNVMSPPPSSVTGTLTNPPTIRRHRKKIKRSEYIELEENICPALLMPDLGDIDMGTRPGALSIRLDPVTRKRSTPTLSPVHYIIKPTNINIKSDESPLLAPDNIPRRNKSSAKVMSKTRSSGKMSRCNSENAFAA